MRTNIGPRTKRSSKKTATKTTTTATQPVKRKLFGGVKGGRRKTDPNAARSAKILKELREYDWLDSNEDTDEVIDQQVEPEDGEVVVCVDTRSCTDDELAAIARDLENGIDTVDSDAISIVQKTRGLLDETKDIETLTSNGKKPYVSRIPAEVAKNLAAFKFFNEDDSKKKDDEFDIETIVSIFKCNHPWFVDTEKEFKASAKKFFADHNHVLAIACVMEMTVKEFMRLFVSRYIDLITPDLVRNSISPCVVKCQKGSISREKAREILLRG